MRQHYQPRPVRRAHAALDLLAALAIGLALAMLGRYTVDVERLRDGKCFRVSGLAGA